VASTTRLTLHLELQAGTNAHHMIEACFKAFARALRTAVALDPDDDRIPSTKGTLT
jgi:imidazoleglycerol-phosphate dehydratase